MTLEDRMQVLKDLSTITHRASEMVHRGCSNFTIYSGSWEMSFDETKNIEEDESPKQ